MKQVARDRGRGRRILCVMGGVFLGAQIAAGLLFDNVWPQVRFAFLHRQIARAEERADKPTVICLGSSRFGTCLLDQELTRLLSARSGTESRWVFNAAAPAGDLLTSEHILKRLLAVGMKPRVLLIELSPEALNRHNGWMSFHVERQLCWNELPAYLPEVSRAGELGRLVMCRLFPLYAHRKGVWNAMGDSMKALGRRVQSPGEPTQDWNRAIGITPLLTDEEKARKTQEGLAHTQKCLRNYAPGGLARQALERMLSLCREHDITPLLIGVPVSSPHRALYTPAIEDAFQNCLREIRETHGCAWMDCRGRIPDALFFDNHHASTEGGMRFSQWVAAEVLAGIDCGR